MMTILETTVCMILIIFYFFPIQVVVEVEWLLYKQVDKYT